MESLFYSPEQHQRKCGQIVSSTLQSIGGKGTTYDILDEISSVFGQPEESIEPELRRTLRRAVREGFLTKEGNTYLFPTYEYEYEVDARGSKRGSSSVGNRSRTDRERKAIASKSQNKRRSQLVNSSRSRSTLRKNRSTSKSRYGTK